MTHCPTPWKRSYSTQGGANRALGNLRASQRRLAAFQHIYQCPCGSWHVGDRRRKPRRSKPKGAW